MERREFEGFGGLRIVADAFGAAEAPPVVLVHSGGQAKEFWHGSAKALAEAGRYAICIDLRGHGESGHAPDGRYDLDAQVQDLRAVLSALPSRALVVGAGLGGIIALATVGESAPHLVSGLALVDVNIWFEEAELKRLHAALIERTTRAETSEQIVDALSAAHPGEPAPADRQRLLTAFTRRQDGRLEWRGDPKALDKHRPVRPAGTPERGRCAHRRAGRADARLAERDDFERTFAATAGHDQGFRDC